MVYVCNYKQDIMIRTGIIGPAKNLINTIKKISSDNEYTISGLFTYDSVLDIYPAIDISSRFFINPEELISGSDVIIIPGQAGEYEELIQKALKKSRHLFISPDTSLSLFQLETFIKLSEEAGVVLFLYHKDLNNLVPNLLKHHFGKPEFIDIYRSVKNSGPDPRKNIMDVFYEEIFMVMQINPVNTRKYFTTSIPYFSNKPSLLNVRIEFENGTSANVTINKFHGENKNRLEIFRHNSIASVYQETNEIKIIQKNPDKNLIIPDICPVNYNSFETGLRIFKNFISSGDYKSDKTENGVSAHRIAAEIIHQLVPSSEKVYF
jgi:hypothetical protein